MPSVALGFWDRATSGWAERLQQGGEPQSTQASHIPPWLSPSDRNRQGAPRGLSATGSKHQGGGRQPGRAEQSRAAASGPGRPHGAQQRPTPMPGPPLGAQEGPWGGPERRQGGGPRPLLGSACPLETQPPQLLTVPRPMPAECGAAAKCPRAKAGMQPWEAKAQPGTYSHSSPAAPVLPLGCPLTHPHPNSH